MRGQGSLADFETGDYFVGYQLYHFIYKGCYTNSTPEYRFLPPSVI